jgi:hypothetical protein
MPSAARIALGFAPDDYDSGVGPPSVRNSYALWLSNTSLVVDHLRLGRVRTPIVGLEGDYRSGFVKFPARGLVAARGALEEHAVLLELKHAVMPMQTAEGFANPVEHPFSKPFRVRRLREARREAACCRQ